MSQINFFKTPQSGNVLFLILIAVALFSALSYVVSQSARSGSSNVDTEKAGLIATATLQQAISIRTAITRMIATGTSPENVRLHVTGQTWNPCTTEANCIFDPRQIGAINGVLIPDPEVDIYGNGFGYAEIGDAVSINGIGTSAPELVLFRHMTLGPKGKAICEAINKGLGIAGIPEQVAGPATFNAVYGASTLCLKNYSDFYYFYMVLYEN